MTQEELLKKIVSMVEQYNKVEEAKLKPEDREEPEEDLEDEEEDYEDHCHERIGIAYLTAYCPPSRFDDMCYGDGLGVYVDAPGTVGNWEPSFC